VLFRSLDLTGGALLAERVTIALAGELGRHAAHELVQRAALRALADGRDLAGVLAEHDEVRRRLDEEQLRRLLEPTAYLGASGALVDRALRAHRERGARPG
jgi:3-carboxy-cis,cis-muconate cycloisomerase